MAGKPKRPMTRRQAENLARGNPRVKARLDAGEFDTNPPAAKPAPRARKPAPAPRPRVSAPAPPAKPRARSTNTRPVQENVNDPPPKRGAITELISGFFDV